MANRSYTDKQIQFIMEAKVKGLTYLEIAGAYNDKFNDRKSADSIRKAFETYRNDYDLPEFETHPEKVKKEKKKQVLSKFTELVKAQKAVPTKAELMKAGVSDTAIKTHFGSFEDLEKEARDSNPKVFKPIIDENSFTDERFESQKKLVKKYKRFVITSPINGKEVDSKMLASIKTYCDANDALALFPPVNDPASNMKSKYKWNIDPRLPQLQVVFRDLKLNNSVFISGIKLQAKQIKPLTGLAKIAQKQGSMIVASPKQDLEIVGTGADVNSKIALMSTGSVTLPSYDSDHYAAQRTAYFADADHIMGGLIIEIVNDDIFYFRQFQVEPTTGKFRDLNKEYSPSGIKKVRADIVRFGDYHVDELDPGADKMGREVCEIMKPRFLVIEDAFNGNSVSHWDRGNPVKQAQKHDEGLTSLPEEGRRYAEALSKLLTLPVDMVVNVYGNHEDFLARYLSDINAPYLREPQNTKIAVMLLNEMLQTGAMPHETLVRSVYGLTSKKLKFLKLDEKFAPNGIENGAHGHIGLNGHYNPSLEGIQKAYGAANVGHNHTPAIRNNVFRGGTFSILRPGFVKGPSTWMHSLIIEHENGGRQIINLIDGKWFLDDGILD